MRVFLTPRKGSVRRASRWEDRRRASAGGPRTFRPGRAGTATRSVRPVRVRGTPVFTQSHPGQQGIHKLPSFFNSKVWKGLLPALAGNECRTNRHHNKYQHVGGRKGMVVGQNQNAKPQGNGTGARKRFRRSRFFCGELGVRTDDTLWVLPDRYRFGTPCGALWCPDVVFVLDWYSSDHPRSTSRPDTASDHDFQR